MNDTLDIILQLQNWLERGDVEPSKRATLSAAIHRLDQLDNDLILVRSQLEQEYRRVGR